MNYKELIKELNKTKPKDKKTILKYDFLRSITNMLKRRNMEDCIVEFKHNKTRNCDLDTILFYLGKNYNKLIEKFVDDTISIYINKAEMRSLLETKLERNIIVNEMSGIGIYHKMNQRLIPKLEEFIIYRDIEYCASEKGTKLSNKEIEDLKGVILNFYNEDSIRNFPLSHSTKFIAENYIDGNITLKELRESSFYDIYDAIENDNIEQLCFLETEEHGLEESKQDNKTKKRNKDYER